MTDSRGSKLATEVGWISLNSALWTLCFSIHACFGTRKYKLIYLAFDYPQSQTYHIIYRRETFPSAWTTAPQGNLPSLMDGRALRDGCENAPLPPSVILWNGESFGGGQGRNMKAGQTGTQVQRISNLIHGVQSFIFFGPYCNWRKHSVSKSTGESWFAKIPNGDQRQLAAEKKKRSKEGRTRRIRRIRLEVRSAKKESQRGRGEDGLGEWIRDGNRSNKFYTYLRFDMTSHFVNIYFAAQ